MTRNVILDGLALRACSALISLLNKLTLSVKAGTHKQTIDSGFILRMMRDLYSREVSMRPIQMGVIAVGLLALGVGPAHAAGAEKGLRGYAEGLYAEYAAGAGHEIAFDVKTLATGSMKQIADVPFGQLVAATDHRVDAEQVGTELRAPRFVASYARGFDVFMASELKNTPRGFESLAGRSLEGGIYRRLGVTATIGSETRQHEALEFCWASLGHCTVLDPTVMFLESMVTNRMRLVAQGWGPKRVDEPRDAAPSDQPGTLAACGMASNPATQNRSLTWGAYTIEYKNVFGGVLIRKAMGGQQSGLRCNTSCAPAPYGYSNASSCQGFLGWSCDCDNKFGYGTTGTTGKWISESKCTHKYAFTANASASVSNLGSANVSISWSLDGTPDSNGGQLMDTCGYY
jgi:hypothetical protein